MKQMKRKDKTGKMISNLSSVTIRDIVEAGQFLWFISFEYRILYRFSKEKKCVDYLALVPDEDKHMNSYSKIVIQGKYLVLVPYCAKSVAVFNMEDLRFEKLELPLPNRLCKFREFAKFTNAINYESQIYLLPGEYPDILCMDVEKGNINSAGTWYVKYGKMYSDLSEGGHIGPYKGIETSCYFDSDCIYIMFFGCDKGKVGRYILQTQETEVYSIDDVNCYFSCIKGIGDELYLITRVGEIICWNKVSRQVVSRNSWLGDYDSEKISAEDISVGVFSESILCDNKLYLFWRECLQYLVFDIKEKRLQRYTYNCLESPVSKIVMDNAIYILTKEKGIFYRIDDGQIEKMKVHIANDALRNFITDEYPSGSVYLHEDAFWNIQKFPVILPESKTIKNEANIDIGKKIFLMNKM